MRTALTAAFVSLALLAGGTTGLAGPVDDARARRDTALGEVRALVSRFETLHRRYERVEARATRASAGLVDAYRTDLSLQGRLAGARQALADRARALYQSGPAGLFEAYLGVESPTDALTIQAGIEAAFVQDTARMAEVLDQRGETASLRARLGDRKRNLEGIRRTLSRLRTDMGFALLRARAAARQAGARVAALERQARTLRKAERRAESTSVEAGPVRYGADQADLLRMLGPDGGRGCDLPAGLRRTGTRFSGVASWYGEDFAGRPTASGAIFDPRLFTAAHRTLPLPSFLFVRHGDRCATVLVNDRGPFIEGRVLDLSQGAAEYLGVGLSTVRAEVLAPA